VRGSNQWTMTQREESVEERKKSELCDDISSLVIVRAGPNEDITISDIIIPPIQMQGPITTS
jgi:hypothetical protein